MSGDKYTFTEAIASAHREGLIANSDSLILGLGVNYANGADGTTKGLAAEFGDRVMDVPVSEASFTGMAVGMGNNGLNPIVHHGRVEFALLACDQILTQAAKWNFMFGGDYPCSLGIRLNIGRQWGNGPQHTSSYSSLFLNTPGLNIYWPSRPSEAAYYTKQLHSLCVPTISMEHRYLFGTKDSMTIEDPANGEIQTGCIYGSGDQVTILTYGDGLVEALRIRHHIPELDIKIICLTSFVNDRELDEIITSEINKTNHLIVIDTANYNYGLLQGVLGQLAEKINLSAKIKIFSSPFTPCATAPSLVKEYYPRAPDITDYLISMDLTKKIMDPYTFDEFHLPADYDFSSDEPLKILKSKIE